MPTRSAAPAMSLGSVVAVLAAVLAAGCDRPNPLYHARDDAATGQAGDPGTAGTTGAAGDMGAAGDPGPAGQAGTPGAAGSTDGGAAGNGDASAPACKKAADCLAERGPAPCGAWECRNDACAVVCAQCLDADRDGYGVGMGCAGPDCDDTNPNVGGSATRACYEGKGGTMGVGTCHAGAQVCTDGVWSGCNGQVLPSGEACNGLDDDCNGKPDDGLGTIACGLGACAQTAMACSNGALGVCQPAATVATTDDCDGKDNDCDGAIDEDCAMGCLRVTPNGDDGAANGTTMRPFRSIQAAINYAAAVPSRPKAVCVAGGMTCADTASFLAPDGSPITMANGVSVYGNYELKNWTRCPVSAGPTPTLNVTIEPRSVKGVLFPATVTLPTIIDGVRINHFTTSMGMGNGPATAAVSVEGARNVVISNVLISDTQDVQTSYGVLLTGGAEALITRSSILGGAATMESVGVRSVSSKPTIRDNCNPIDPATGRCTGPCTVASLGIRGRVAQTAGTRAVAVDLVDSPGAIVERTSICGTQAANGFGVRVSGAATGTILRGNWIAAAGGTSEARGVSLEPCADAAPWIVGNELIQADGPMRVAGVSALGACHPVIDGNVKITTGGEGTPSLATGVTCGAMANVASRCALMGNKLVQGSASTRPSQTIAVSCDAGACGRITGNKIVGQGGGDVVGLALSGTGALVDRNDITGGCGTKSTTGIQAVDAFARLENNLVLGASCAMNVVSPSVDGLHVQVAAGGNEVDVHSNTILAGGAGACQGAAASIGLGPGPGPKSPRGILRDNILRAGLCTIARYDFWENTAGTTPRLFQNNDLDPTGAPTALYLTGGGAMKSTAAMVDALPGASGNISADPMFAGANDLHLAAGSACINAGTAAGAPRTDYDGKARDDKPDLGAYEK